MVSVITLKNSRGGGGLLHSHPHLFPEEFGEIQQQQVLPFGTGLSIVKVKIANFTIVDKGSLLLKVEFQWYIEH